MFPDVNTGVACQLAEIEVVKPSNVLELVPEASMTQIAAFLRIAEEEGGDNTKIVAPVRSGTPKLEAGTSQLEWLKRMSAAGVKKTRQLDSPTVEDSQFMKELEKLVPPKDGGNGNMSVDFSEKFQEKILGLLGSTDSSRDFAAERAK